MRRGNAGSTSRSSPNAEIAAIVPDSDSDSDSDADGDDGLALVAFSLLLLIMPIMVYFMTLKYVFAGKTAASAIAAVVAANLVLELEDREQDSKAKKQ
ncbi:hypothetical protein DL89DRAFT_291396 [Linderina pennispora]|uniref:Vacuolar ATPase assembly integral membrane protein VMA21 n=1 Tax=Linderina pennispora TaxID=61395 RepID=A0A1Y1WFJ6_9FUNG|nr:uncharacterized protein DL89DRAFT_291396 [Linderina pennispora]ORX72175.1 hypothetical protein DL89DRAFT_291396 [Linderina pennispora]